MSKRGACLERVLLRKDLQVQDTLSHTAGQQTAKSFKLRVMRAENFVPWPEKQHGFHNIGMLLR